MRVKPSQDYSSEAFILRANALLKTPVDNYVKNYVIAQMTGIFYAMR